MKIIRFIFFFLIGFNYSDVKSQAFIPNPDHVVMLIMENTTYSQIVGPNAAPAPYINSLINDPKCALFTNSHGLARPSQPNYLQLFSGSTQGVTSNNIPAGIPFTTPNICAQLLSAGKTFKSYCETMPSAGYTGEFSGAYARKHNPCVNWQGASVNGVPASLNETFLAFPNSANYNSLPHFSIVVPNQDNDMHNGTFPTRITTGDTWIQNNLDSYIQWAKSNNSLFILTFDEDDFIDQHILSLVIGPMVNHGSYADSINHYHFLGLLEDMFNLPRIANAIGAAPIDFCWASPCYAQSVINTSGPTTICQGSSVTLTAAGGASWLWSTGATTQSIVVNSSGTYSVTVNDGAGCISTSSNVNVTVNTFSYTGTIFTESMGTVSVNTAIATHETNNGFDNDVFLMSGTGEIRASSPSSGYAGATAAGNAFLTNAVGRYFQIENINTSVLPNLQLSFGLFKNNTTSTGVDLSVQYSTNGTTFTNLTFDPLPTGTGTNNKWSYRTAVGSIPTSSNLRLKFLQNGAATQYRIDDVSLKYVYTTPQITAGGPTSFCTGGNVTLSSTPASTYLWSNGATTQNINVTTSGNYSVVQSGQNGCTATSNIISVSVAPAPLISGMVPSNGVPGTPVTISGSNFMNVTSVKFNGTPAVFTVDNSGQISTTVPAGAQTGTISVTNNCNTAVSSLTFTVNYSPSVLEVTLFVEGYYIGNRQMTSVLGGSDCDSITIELWSAQAPHILNFSEKGLLSTSGICTVTFPPAANGNSHYIVVYGRNSLKVWSASSVLFNSNLSYDFSTTASQAFGSNLKDLGDTNFALFSGDVNSDGNINLQDHHDIINSTKNFRTGYDKNDLNGDYSVESADFSLIDNNLNLLEIQP